MLSYRIYFRGSGVIVGRDDFKAADDGAALLIACTLRDACSDVCDRFELWNGIRRVDWRLNSAATSARPNNVSAEEIVVEREMAIRDSAWQIARSKRLLDQVQHLLDAQPS